MTFPVGEVSLEALIESRKSIEQEILKRVQDELATLDARRATLLTLLGGEPCIDADDVVLTPVTSLPKYRDPASGKTWSGKGKRPRWFAVDRADDFLIAYQTDPVAT